MLFRSANRVGPDLSRAQEANAKQIDRNAYKALDYFLNDSHAMSQFPQTALRTLGIPMDTQGNVDPLASKALLDMANAQLQATLAFNDRATGWIYSDSMTGGGRRPDGVLHGLDSLGWQGDKESQAYRILHGDLVVLRLETFPADEAERLAAVTRVIDKLADLGATVALTDTAAAACAPRQASNSKPAATRRSPVPPACGLRRTRHTAWPRWRLTCPGRPRPARCTPTTTS